MRNEYFVKKKISHKEVIEFDLLELYVEDMEHYGKSRKSMWLEIDEDIVARLSAKGFATTLSHIQTLADRCIAKGWLRHNGRMGKHRYDNLELTTAGFGVVQSRQRQQKQLEARGRLKRISDYIEDHKGLFGVLLGSAIALSSLIMTIIKFFHKEISP